jgi:hypothetical protein
MAVAMPRLPITIFDFMGMNNVDVADKEKNGVVLIFSSIDSKGALAFGFLP